MAKIPSRKFSTVKNKIPSTKFPTAKRKISSEQFPNQTAKRPLRKSAKAKKAKDQNQHVETPLDHPSDAQARLEVVATLKLRTDALKQRVKTKTAR